MKITIGKRVLFGFGASLAITVGLGIFAFSRIQTLDAGAKRVVVDCLPGEFVSGRLEALAVQNFQMLFEYVEADTPESKTAVLAEMKAHSALMDQTCKDYEDTITTEDDRNTYNAIPAARSAYTICPPAPKRIASSTTPFSASTASSGCVIRIRRVLPRIRIFMGWPPSTPATPPRHSG